MALKNLQDVFEHQLKDLYSAENQLTEALPKMVEAAASEDLKQAFKRHLEETKKQKERISDLGQKLGVKVTGEKCKAMEGLIKEGSGLIEENESGDALDVALIAAAQRVEHYEISAYGSTVAYAKRLGHDEAQKTLQKTLDEEYDADNKLGKLAEETINKEAIQS